MQATEPDETALPVVPVVPASTSSAPVPPVSAPPVPSWAHRMHEQTHRWLANHPWLRFAYRALIAVIGGAIVIAGVIMIPLPGPGWLIVILGLGVLGTEFVWAHRLASWFHRLIRRGFEKRREWKERRAAKRDASV